MGESIILGGAPPDPHQRNIKQSSAVGALANFGAGPAFANTTRPSFGGTPRGFATSSRLRCLAPDLYESTIVVGLGIGWSRFSDICHSFPWQRGHSVEGELYFFLRSLTLLRFSDIFNFEDRTRVTGYKVD
jgi:hypothetical protein